MQPNIHGKLDLFSIFDASFDRNKMYRLDEQVEVKILCVKFDQLDKQIFCILLNAGSKRIEGNEVTCRIETDLLRNRVGMMENELFNRIRKLLSLGVNVYTKIADAEYNFCVFKRISEKGRRIAYEVTFNHLDVLKRVFDVTFIDLLTSGMDEEPSGVHKLVTKESELFFLNYTEAFGYGKRELKPQQIEYQIYQVKYNELVFVAEYLNINPTQEGTNLNKQLPEVKKLDFMDIFNSEFQKDNISIGISDDVVVTIECPQLTLTDKNVFTTIWSNGEKFETDNNIVSTISEELLYSHVSSTDYVLEGTLRRLSRVSIGVKYSFQGERREGRYNIFDVAASIDVSGRLQAVTMGVKSKMTWEWLFSEESLKIMND